jgi:hypothetical protein
MDISKIDRMKELTLTRLQSVLKADEQVMWQEFPNLAKRPATIFQMLLIGIVVSFCVLAWPDAPWNPAIAIILIWLPLFKFMYPMVTLRPDDLYVITNQRIIVLHSSGQSRSFDLRSVKNVNESKGYVTFASSAEWKLLSGHSLLWLSDSKSAKNILKDVTDKVLLEQR